MTTPALFQAIQRARDQAKAILDTLEQLATLCTGKLAWLKPLLEEAARLARGGQGG